MVVVVLVSIALLARASRGRIEYRDMRCKNNLRMLGTGMIQYIDQYGKGRYYTWPGPQKPSFTGGQWVASMYWVSLLNEPDIYICPKSGDTNSQPRFFRRGSGGDGAFLGRSFGPIGPGHVSYAGRTGILGAIEDKMPSNALMMSDDTEATANHEDGVNLLYFDAHVEWNQQVSPLAKGEAGKARIGFDRPVDMLRN
jgi:prepilin-type processing-associated H-X9-DG protein